jgi:hypothetical protein
VLKRAWPLLGHFSHPETSAVIFGWDRPGSIAGDRLAAGDGDAGAN